ncbi:MULTISPECIES: hypothetical protein [unclassified Bacteroides]|uniref:hypothetical protein n=1 Tax=unclassified Bacteroides TaxID=2646097 RepID=UPI004063F19D
MNEKNNIRNISADDLLMVTPEWVDEQLTKHGLRRNDIIRQLGFDKASLSLILSGKRGMPKSTRAAFYFYFLAYELS